MLIIIIIWARYEDVDPRISYCSARILKYNREGNVHYHLYVRMSQDLLLLCRCDFWPRLCFHRHQQVFYFIGSHDEFFIILHCLLQTYLHYLFLDISINFNISLAKISITSWFRNETLECHAFLCPKRKMAQAATLTIAQVPYFEIPSITYHYNTRYDHLGPSWKTVLSLLQSNAWLMIKTVINWRRSTLPLSAGRPRRRR